MTRPHQFFTIALLAALALAAGPTNAQQMAADVQAAVDAVFGPATATQPAARPPSSRTRGFGNIVTPEPPGAGQQPLRNQPATEEPCTCVSYHMCDPANNRLIAGAAAVPDFDGFGVIDIRADFRECEAVLDVCCMGQFQREVTIPVPPVEQKKNRAAGCGIRNVGGLDFQLAGVKNNEAGFGEFPWTVALIRIIDDQLVCVGSLIHPKMVLTGNHCVKEFLTQPKEMKIRAGEWDTQTTKERLPYQERATGRIFSHPKYNERSLAYDVALIELEDPFILADHISTVCLPQFSYVPQSRECFASGWGKTLFGKEGQFSVIQKRVPLPTVPHAQCQEQLRQTRLTQAFRLDESFVCAGGVPGVDTCQGDGGAPLVCPVGPPRENRYVQAGIVAWGIGCNEPHPAVYANVALARDWIDQQVRYIGLDAAYYTY